MDTVFIVRPFGKKRPVIKKNEDGTPGIVFFDFDKVENDLIIPAMNVTGLRGGTTQRIFEAGEIKEDMFTQLLISDIVIADITIHNANVFYELGIRHALRKKTTVLIKCEGFDETPFDIIGYKYVSYQKDNPAASLDTLVQFLTESPASERNDSPVFNMLPALSEQETESFLALPADFTQEVQIAAAGRRPGELSLLAMEAGFFPWKIPALRLIGEELFNLNALDAGRVIWETIKGKKQNDVEANNRLATVYQRLAETEMVTNPSEGMALLMMSDLAIEALLKNANLDAGKRAEVYALKGRNAKAKWINSWRNSADEQKGPDALQSIFLESSYKNYESGYYENLNHFYSGINALGLLTTMIELAQRLTDVWTLPFSSDEEAAQKLNELKEKRQKLVVSIEVCLAAEKRRQEGQGTSDIWLDITGADFICLTATKPAKIAMSYKKVLQSAEGFEIEAVTNQLRIYEQLNIFPDNIKAALNVIRPVESLIKVKSHFILFTGHMIDKPARKEPRFPAEKESEVRQKIKEKVLEEKNKINAPITGIAGGACGGDILFHEICEELGIRTELYLAISPENFKAESVAFAGAIWIERFDLLFQKVPHCILCDTPELPGWLQKKNDYSIWERNNLWELNSALVNGGMHMTLIALWDGKGGDGTGGTEHMVNEAKERGAKAIIIDI